MKDERLLELLADRASGDLAGREFAESQQLPQSDDQSMEYAAAAASLALAHPLEQPPLKLRDRLLADATQYFNDLTTPMKTKGSLSWGWLAAAAMLIVSIAGWWPQSKSPDNAQLLEQMLTQEGVSTLAFGATEDPYANGSSGELVWDNKSQQGFMKIRGLHRNNPNQNQYQLWIFDQQRDDRYPIDGGVFDVTADEVIIPIDARLAVAQPSLFAITVEQPGGVVVSSRERIVLAAKVN